MAVPNNARTVAFERAFLRTFRRTNVMSQLFNRSREGAMQNRYQMSIPRYKSVHPITENDSFYYDHVAQSAGCGPGDAGVGEQEAFQPEYRAG